MASFYENNLKSVKALKEVLGDGSAGKIRIREIIQHA
jgi:hypothetical protein